MRETSMNPLRRYAHWLHTRWPAGTVERLPQINEDGSTDVAGLYVVGDLAGVPLLKFSSDTGARAVKTITSDPRFIEARREQDKGQAKDAPLDLVIVGAGVSGMAAALLARKWNLRFAILEAAQVFSTVVNFPKKKPIYTYPKDMTPAGDLQFHADIKEGLVDELREQTRDIEVRTARVESIERSGGIFTCQLAGGESLRALRVIIAIGRSGDFRRLGVPGEELDKVYNRLHDPKDYAGQQALVVGGGDSALETAIALCQAGATVTLSYRKAELSRPKAENREAVEELAGPGASGPGLTLLLGSQVKEIRADEVLLADKDGQAVTLPNDVVFAMIGREAPLDFLRLSGVRIQGEWRVQSAVACALFVLFCVVLYNWKSGGTLSHITDSHHFFPHTLAQKVNDVRTETFDSAQRSGVPSIDSAQRSGVPSIDSAQRSGNVPGQPVALRMNVQKKPWEFLNPQPAYPPSQPARTPVTAAPLQTGSCDPLPVLGCVKDRTTFLGTLAISASGPSFWYTLAYSTLILIFGVRRMRRRKTPYVNWQTGALMAVQIVPLFLLPEIIFPWMGYHGLLPRSLADALFPAVDYGHGREYWRAYGLILAWPLFVYNLFTDNPLWAWLGISLVQTFVLLPTLIYFYGKGVYCGWICSCGALAETLGDNHRQKMVHGPGWNKVNMVGQGILFVAFLLLILRVVGWMVPSLGVNRYFSVLVSGSYNDSDSFFTKWFNYKWVVDVFLAGIVGYGLYFWYSGRVWCRFMCPLAALMHIYARFSRFRIFADKKKCISCNVCTSVCHMGIDVMSFANKGLPMQDPECVRCSACVSSCPTGVLTFGQATPDNKVLKYDRLPGSLVQIRERPRS